jgi:CRP-like cAMP-binding protein
MAKPTNDQLRAVPLFAMLEDGDLESLSEEFNDRSYPAGAAMTTEGEGGLVFFIIDSGEASVTVGDREVARLGAGEHFGEVALIDKRPRTATVTAATDTKCFTLPVWSFRPFVEARPEVAWKLLEALADRLEIAQARSTP